MAHHGEERGLGLVGGFCLLSQRDGFKASVLQSLLGGTQRGDVMLQAEQDRFAGHRVQYPAHLRLMPARAVSGVHGKVLEKDIARHHHLADVVRNLWVSEQGGEIGHVVGRGEKDRFRCRVTLQCLTIEGEQRDSLVRMSHRFGESPAREIFMFVNVGDLHQHGVMGGFLLMETDPLKTTGGVNGESTLRVVGPIFVEGVAISQTGPHGGESPHHPMAHRLVPVSILQASEVGRVKQRQTCFVHPGDEGAFKIVDPNRCTQTFKGPHIARGDESTRIGVPQVIGGVPSWGHSVGIGCRGEEGEGFGRCEKGCVSKLSNEYRADSKVRQRHDLMVVFVPANCTVSPQIDTAYA